MESGPGARESPDDHVTVVEDAVAFTRSLRKDADAKWIAGLHPSDVDAAEHLGPRRARSDTPEEFSGLRNFAPMAHSPMKLLCLPNVWLRYPLILGTFAVVSSAMSLIFHPELLHVEFPEKEETLWELLTAQSPSVRVAYDLVLPLLVPSLASVAFAVALCFQIALVTNFFSVLCGIGTALLSVLGSAATAYVLYGACNVRHGTNTVECSTPFAFFWVCSVFRVVAPLVAVGTIAPVLDFVHRTRWLWSVTLGTPVLLTGAGVAQMVATGTANTPLFWWSRVATIASWGMLVFVCARQRPFIVHTRRMMVK